ncbi:MAG TPA: Ig-like domain-containing protein, partial [Gemmatimonadales bacterium]|nr:Ig-like domain-containing protein [Gemmatimonadales bacterium]
MALSLLALASSAACSDQGPGAAVVVVPDPVGVFVSEPVPAAGQVASVMASGAADPVVYVSLQPGTVPDGSTLRVENSLGIGVFQADVANGGLDPVPVHAAAGDVIHIVSFGGPGPDTTLDVAVKARRPLRVVRTEPTATRIDVALNSVILGVFSEPVDPATVSPGTIQLRKNGQAVAGSPVVAPDGYEVAFTPAGALDPLSQYELVITAGVTSLAGEAVDQETRVGFTTGSQSGQLGSLTISPSTPFVLVGGTLQLTAEPRDLNGNLLAGTVDWYLINSDSDAVAVSPTGLVVGQHAGGPVQVYALFQGSSLSVPVTVVPSSNIRIWGTWDYTERLMDSGGLVCSDTGTWVIAQFGAGLSGTSQQVGTCTGAGGTMDNGGSFTINLGSIAGGKLEFASGPESCLYNAQVSGTTPTSLTGPAYCFGSSAPAGTWTATRRSPQRPSPL